MPQDYHQVLLPLEEKNKRKLDKSPRNHTNIINQRNLRNQRNLKSLKDIK